MLLGTYSSSGTRFASLRALPAHGEWRRGREKGGAALRRLPNPLRAKFAPPPQPRAGLNYLSASPGM